MSRGVRPTNGNDWFLIERVRENRAEEGREEVEKEFSIDLRSSRLLEQSYPSQSHL